MTEQLLQFIWQFQYFNKSTLQNCQQETVQVIHQGTKNIHQGPDFTDAKIKIGNTIWAGSVELHLKTSDWEKHKHNNDKNYKNVILHVVYNNDKSINQIPILELQDKISYSLINRYTAMMQVQHFIACEKIITEVREITITGWKHRLLAERLLRKSDLINNYQKKNKQHWEESFWWLLAKNFGTKVNSEAFEAVAQSIPINILAKHKNSLQQIEALLLGQAGLLNENFTDHYPVMLQKEYHFLKTKYQLQPTTMPVYFLRMRPGNFPTIRLAQLAALIQNSVHLFSKIIEEPALQVVKKWFLVDANDYWHYHYKLDDESVFKPKTIGTAMIHNIIINTAIPMLFAYGTISQNQQLKDKAIQWANELPAEKNAITNGFAKIGIPNKTALDSQAFIELKTQYCNYKKCLQCSIGNSLLKRS
ncbi:MAG: DUF2851 family protein [Niabella sp.]